MLLPNVHELIWTDPKVLEDAWTNAVNFSFPKKYYLAHCVAADLRMGAGIAAKFKLIYGQVDALRAQKIGTVGIAVLNDYQRFIRYLVTKDESWQNPTYDNLRSIFESNATAYARPRIGCGLDALEWDKVCAETNEIFYNDNVDIVAIEEIQEVGNRAQVSSFVPYMLGPYTLANASLMQENLRLKETLKDELQYSV
uniref:Macro domain-containing protein n=1 Tax=Glossina palpalis gambiensis TaxID=67801 RepID=A0A1B0APV3_9MUSC